MRSDIADARGQVRFPRVLTLDSVYDFLKRAYPAEPQPVERITDALTYLEDRGFWFVTCEGEKLQCRGCMKVYGSSGNAEKHKCGPPALLA